MEKEDKNNQEQEFKGRNLEDAISLAEHIFKAQRAQLDYEIVAEKTRLFGIKSKEIVIRAWPKKTDDDSPATKFLDKLLAVFPLNISYYIRKRNDILHFIFEGEDKPLLLRKDGSLLLAIQHILNKVSPQKVQTDCNFYRKRKEQELRDLARDVASHVQNTGREETLDFMNPYERRIIHMAINEVPGITSESIGDGFLKRIKIQPVKD